MFNILDSLLAPAELPDFQAALQTHPKRAVRIRDDFQDSSLPFETTAVPWNEHGRFLVNADCRPGAYLQYPAACYYIQDAGSLLPVSLLNPQPGELICDLCAAPGGKSTAILERMNGQGVLVANEPIRTRTNVLKFMLGRTGLPNYLTTELDPERMAQKFTGLFDAVIVDAPCSGQMMVARDKRDANAWSSRQIEHSAARQQRILDASMKLLRPGGRLVYSTCTFAVEENEAQVMRLLKQYGSMLSPLICEELKEWESPVQKGCYRLWPHRDLCAGGFAGGIVLSENFEQELEDRNVEGNAGRDRKESRNRSRSMQSKKSETMDLLVELSALGDVSNGQSRSIDDEVYFGTEMVWSLFDACGGGAKPPLAMLREKRRTEPSHTLALSRNRWFQSKEAIALDDAQAIAFLAGESIRGLEPSTKSAWVRILWNARPLGWGRFSQGQLKNHLPSWARVAGLVPSPG